jgi:dimethylaniline monooxygenase (N-oxide forming)
VQSTFELYEYPCKKFPEHIRNRSDPPAPTSQEVCDYLDEYIDEKKMRSKFHFGTRIAAILCNSETEWTIEFDTDFSTMKTFSFVIVCTGLVSSNPNVLKLRGRKAFLENGGKIIHSSERRSNEIFEGKKVLVIGNGKSAVDAAAAAAEVAKVNSARPPIQMARRQTWYVPRYLLGCIQYKYAFHSRIGSALLPRYYETTSFFWSLPHFIFTPLKWLTWRLVELVLLIQFRLPFRIWPKLGTIEKAALENSVVITDEKHLRCLRKGEIDMRVGIVERLEPGKAVLSNGKVEDVDVVVLATGWKLAFELFMDVNSIFAGLDFEKDCLDFGKDGLWLYRNVLPAGFKGLAFVGSNTLTFMNIYTSYIQAYWLAQLLAGERPWPDETHMKKTVEREKAFKRRYYPSGEMRAAAIEAYMQHYHDVLFQEMNARQPFNCLVRPLAYLVAPVLPSLMKGCLEPHQLQAADHDDASCEDKGDSRTFDTSTRSPVSDGSRPTSTLDNDDEKGGGSDHKDSASVDASDIWVKNCDSEEERSLGVGDDNEFSG